jgi:hypothetical protein
MSGLSISAGRRAVFAPALVVLGGDSVKVASNSIATFIGQLKVGSSTQRAIAAATLAILSALLSNYVPDYGYLTVTHVSFLAAIWFGLLLFCISVLWVSSSPFDLFALLVTSCVAWYVANRAGMALHDLMMEEIRNSIVSNGDVVKFIRTPIGLIAICGLLGGFIGSSVVVFGIALVRRDSARMSGWSQTILLGTLTGLLLECGLGQDEKQTNTAIHIGSFLPLFLVWQTSVAASIAYHLNPQRALAQAKKPAPVFSPPVANTSVAPPKLVVPLQTAEKADQKIQMPEPTVQLGSRAPSAPPAPQHVDPPAPETASRLVVEPTQRSTSATTGTGLGFGIAAIVFAILGIFFPFGVILSIIAIALALIGAFLGDKICSVATALIALVNTFVLSPTMWIYMSSDTSGLLKFGLAGVCLLPIATVLIKAIRPTAAA